MNTIDGSTRIPTADVALRSYQAPEQWSNDVLNKYVEYHGPFHQMSSDLELGHNLVAFFDSLESLHHYLVATCKKQHRVHATRCCEKALTLEQSEELLSIGLRELRASRVCRYWERFLNNLWDPLNPQRFAKAAKEILTWQDEGIEEMQTELEFCIHTNLLNGVCLWPPVDLNNPHFNVPKRPWLNRMCHFPTNLKERQFWAKAYTACRVELIGLLPKMKPIRKPFLSPWVHTSVVDEEIFTLIHRLASPSQWEETLKPLLTNNPERMLLLTGLAEYPEQSPYLEWMAQNVKSIDLLQEFTERLFPKNPDLARALWSKTMSRRINEPAVLQDNMGGQWIRKAASWQLNAFAQTFSAEMTTTLLNSELVGIKNGQLRLIATVLAAHPDHNAGEILWTKLKEPQFNFHSCFVILNELYAQDPAVAEAVVRNILGHVDSEQLMERLKSFLKDFASQYPDNEGKDRTLNHYRCENALTLFWNEDNAHKVLNPLIDHYYEEKNGVNLLLLNSLVRSNNWQWAVPILIKFLNEKTNTAKRCMEHMSDPDRREQLVTALLNSTRPQLTFDAIGDLIKNRSVSLKGLPESRFEELIPQIRNKYTQQNEWVEWTNWFYALTADQAKTVTEGMELNYKWRESQIRDLKKLDEQQKDNDLLIKYCSLDMIDGMHADAYDMAKRLALRCPDLALTVEFPSRALIKLKHEKWREEESFSYYNEAELALAAADRDYRRNHFDKFLKLDPKHVPVVLPLLLSGLEREEFEQVVEVYGIEHVFGCSEYLSPNQKNWLRDYVEKEGRRLIEEADRQHSVELTIDKLNSLIADAVALRKSLKYILAIREKLEMEEAPEVRKCHEEMREPGGLIDRLEKRQQLFATNSPLVKEVPLSLSGMSLEPYRGMSEICRSEALTSVLKKYHVTREDLANQGIGWWRAQFILYKDISSELPNEATLLKTVLKNGLKAILEKLNLTDKDSIVDYLKDFD